ncbi:hypothetical protein BGW38_009211 [Lunasporangiospora selenospora]|uniref:Transmembrane protein n=1 Tax=Lunasporangiospora selenospora TaxID=979761 RepID=A0A9P6K8R1_9FUNG|nr:hypothetical protein BGW38_009211 [Lunasporangiospora selenospora]
MGSTVWAHLIRLDGHDDEEEAEEEHEQEIADQVRERNTARLEARGLLSGMTDSAKLQQHTPFRIQGRSLVSKSRWLRTRLLPVVTFVSLAAVVGLNAFVRAHEAGAGHPSGSD